MSKENKREKVTLLPSDYYINQDGLYVFTDTYLEKRGYCCGNKCLHCPYEPKAVKGNTTLIKK